MYSTSQSAPEHAPDTPHRILVVDDDPLMRMHARTVLESAGHQVLEADSGERALECIDQESLDGVLLDLGMPGLDGYQTCTSLRERLEEDPLPIVIVTANGDFDAIERSFSVGATDFVTKPINWPILKQRLRYLVRNRYTARDLEDSENSRRALIETVPDSILSVDREGNLHEIKGSLKGSVFDVRIFESKTLFEALPERSVETARAALGNVLDGGGSGQFEFELDEEGESRSYEVRLVATDLDRATLMVRDITERAMAEARIRHLAYRDQLTGLPNAAAMHEVLIERGSAQRGAMLSDAVVRIGIDNLGYFESVYGHVVKNELVRRVSRRLKMMFFDAHSRGGMLARVSEAEFVLMMPMLERDMGLDSLLDRVEHCLRPIFEIDGRELQIDLSIGVAHSPEDGHGTLLLDRTANALDHARKSTNDRRCRYSTAIHESSLRQADLQSRLSRAIKESHIFLVYQPKFAATDGSLKGVEALVRWNDPQLGFVSPGEFIPLAEQCGLILPLGEKIMELACEQAKIWHHSAGGCIPIAINFSGQQFSRPEMPSMVAEALARHGLDGRAIEIEITESAAISSPELVKTIVGQLHRQGIRVAIDDFGTGYSSLGMLRELPFDVLKIDRSFIKDIGNDPSADALVRSIIDMGHALGMEVVAEGIEEEVQRQFLVSNGCDLLQGFMLGRPVPADELLSQGIAA